MDASPAASKLKGLLDDESHIVRAYAAWALIKLGDKDAAYKCFDQLLEGQTYAVLEILNIIDWMGEDGKPLLSAAAKVKGETGFAGSMETYLLHGRKIVDKREKNKNRAPKR